MPTGKEGIKTGGRKAELVERITSSAEYRNQHKAPTSLKRDPESPDTITDDGIVAFCDELGIDPQDPVILVLSWYMEAEAMCVFTRSEFLCGLEKLQCRSIEELKQKLPTLRRRLQNRETFTEIYTYTFMFAKERTQKSLALDIALALWQILLPDYFPLLSHWLLFMKSNARNSVPRDLWMQVLEFGHQVKKDLSNFDENGAWPVLLDEFVSHMQKQIEERGLEVVLKEADDSDAVMEDA
ncbi:hypothetical protein P43SY_005912 [Pythium insidiosum]|uniref:Defective in cullin neddylation protein n=1 Tax=Pythium insidiosum TaxID=114742 RepID=A0AAD5M3B4_PYTIN|nr:hypothetical protein P43SY_005912 [Pythium insidiosum]